MLVINTAFKTAYLALETKDGKIFMKTLDSDSKHSENVLSEIDNLCQEANIDILDVGTIAVVTGPGSFTGLRIGTSIAKALACVNKNLNLISLSSLEFMAYIVEKHRKIEQNFVCVINALSKLYFVAYFNEKGIKLEQEKIVDENTFLAINIPKFAIKGDISCCEDINEINLSCEDMLQFAKEMEKEKKFVKPEELLPKYLRLSQAEDNLLKKNKKV